MKCKWIFFLLFTRIFLKPMMLLIRYINGAHISGGNRASGMLGEEDLHLQNQCKFFMISFISER
ncbi:hypothetical protein FO510_15585 [Bacillus pumilus]|nr:hypothetical protein [Bacillus pumilus]PRS62490.1 hypothetical protein C6X97_12795 [Bacillus pumilus]